MYFYTFHCCFFVSIFHLHVRLYLFSRFRSLSLVSSISLLILFHTLTFFLFHYSFLSFRTGFPLRYLSYRFFNRYIVKRTLLSCLYDTSVYFERIVITPATIASFRCPTESDRRASVQFLRVTQEAQSSRMAAEAFTRTKDRK